MGIRRHFFREFQDIFFILAKHDGNDIIKLQEITSGFLEAVNHFNNLPNLVQTGFSNLLKLFAFSKLI